MFGSCVRGDADEQSDTDILVVVKDGSTIPDLLGLRLASNADVSIYSFERLQEMFSTGHLFAWHLYYESRPYASANDEIFESLGAPAEYVHARSDVSIFLKILFEAVVAFREGSNYIFEAGVLHLAMRNIGISLGYLRNKKSDFSRYAALSIANEFSLGMDRSEYDHFVRCRYISKRGHKILPPEKNIVVPLVEKVESWAVNLARESQ